MSDSLIFIMPAIDVSTITAIAAVIVAAAIGIPAIVIGSAQMMSYAKSHKQSEERKDQLASINHAQAMANLAAITSQSATQTDQTALAGIKTTGSGAKSATGG